MTKGVALGIAAAFLLAPGIVAQEVEEADLPIHVANEVIEFFNDPGTIRFSGRSGIPPDRIIVGDVGVLSGPFIVGGEIDGNLMVVNGDLTFEPGGVVTGDVTVLAGRVSGQEPGAIGGTLTVYDEALRYSYRGDRMEYEGTRPRRTRTFPTLRWGSSRFSVRAGTNYNRIEGLPVMFGPVVRTERPNQFRLDAFAIWRTDNGLSLDGDELGYRVQVEQSFGPRDALAVGGTVHSEIRPIESWGLVDLEASLATFLLHKDYRDYYEETGWSAFVTLRPDRTPLVLSFEYRDEDHEYAPVGSPWALKDNDDPWRPQPVIAEGRLRSLGGKLTLDARNDPEDPSDGWFVEARAHVGVGGTLELPEQTAIPESPVPDGSADPLDLPAREVETDFSSGFLDVTRYSRLGPYSQLNLRALLGGSLTGDPLPPQFQHAPGGEGSIPGYGLFSADCGARSRRVEIATREDGVPANVPAFPAYGCDRIALFQAEYRGGFWWDFGWNDPEDWGFWSNMFFEPSWAVFLNVGRGWSLSEDALEGFRGMDTETLSDLGFGIFLGDIGLYWAIPLNGDHRGVNFFVRLSRRF